MIISRMPAKFANKEIVYARACLYPVWSCLLAMWYNFIGTVKLSCLFESTWIYFIDYLLLLNKFQLLYVSRWDLKFHQLFDFHRYILCHMSFFVPHPSIPISSQNLTSYDNKSSLGEFEAFTKCRWVMLSTWWMAPKSIGSLSSRLMMAYLNPRLCVAILLNW